MADGPRPEDLAREERRKRVYQQRACAVCGENFKPTNGNQKYCSRKCGRMRQGQERICVECKQPYRRDKSTIGRYCSQRCAHVARFGIGEPVPCLYCGQEFIRTGSRKARKFCDHSCAMSYRQQNGDLAHLQKWSIRNKGEDACRNCGRKATHLHHIVPRSKSKGGHRDIRRNGMPLCRDCHYGWHHRTVEIRQHRLTDDEFAFAVLVGGPLWVEQHYPDDPVVRLLRLDELMNRRTLAGDDLPLPFDKRVEATRHLAADVDRRHAA